MVPIASRASWGARFRDGDINLSDLAREVIIHHTTTVPLGADATVEQERAQMRSLERIGQDRFGAGISYNVIIFPSGRAYQGVSFNRRGTHTGGRNSNSRGIAFDGDFGAAAQPTQAAINTAREIVSHGRGRWWSQDAPVRGHRDVSATTCPGRHVVSRLAEIASPVKPLPKSVPVTPTKKEDLTTMANYPFMFRADVNDAWTIALSPSEAINAPALTAAERAEVRALFGEPRNVGPVLAQRLREALTK